MDDTHTSISELYASLDADYQKEVVHSDMYSIMANRRWEIIDHPYKCKLLGCKWLFKNKLRLDGTIYKYKAGQTTLERDLTDGVTRLAIAEK